MATKTIIAWIDGSAQEIEVEEMTSEVQSENIGPVYTTISLPASAWTGNLAPYSQVVTINGITANTQVDLRTTASQIAELQENDIAFIAENENGVVTVYSLNCKPENDYEVQAVLTEVVSL